ncbi:hypothetical protein AAVH_25936 [Aphelenchoides avenae]|nr:hypothetical protein AAVH_25936 [Aphelenchus avenae]
MEARRELLRIAELHEVLPYLMDAIRGSRVMGNFAIPKSFWETNRRLTEDILRKGLSDGMVRIGGELDWDSPEPDVDKATFHDFVFGFKSVRALDIGSVRASHVDNCFLKLCIGRDVRRLIIKPPSDGTFYAASEEGLLEFCFQEQPAGIGAETEHRLHGFQVSVRFLAGLVQMAKDYDGNLDIEIGPMEPSPDALQTLKQVCETATARSFKVVGKREFRLYFLNPEFEHRTGIHLVTISV